MEADFTKLKDDEGNPILPEEGASVEDWQHQTYLTSGSLIAKSCKAAMMLAQHSTSIQDSAYEFGKHIACVHQVTQTTYFVFISIFYQQIFFMLFIWSASLRRYFIQENQKYMYIRKMKPHV